MPDDDEAMLAVYNETLARAAGMLTRLGVKDGEKPTEEQVMAVIRQLLDEMVDSIGIEAALQITPDQMVKDHRKLSRLKKRRDH